MAHADITITFDPPLYEPMRGYYGYGAPRSRPNSPGNVFDALRKIGSSGTGMHSREKITTSVTGPQSKIDSFRRDLKAALAGCGVAGYKSRIVEDAAEKNLVYAFVDGVEHGGDLGYAIEPGIKALGGKIVGYEDHLPGHHECAKLTIMHPNPDAFIVAAAKDDRTWGLSFSYSKWENWD